MVLIISSAFGLSLGPPTFIAALATILFTTRSRNEAIKEVVGAVPWSVLPLVAGLFVLVAALSSPGALHQMSVALLNCGTLPPVSGSLSASFGVAALSNVMNNLPSGLLAGSALQVVSVPDYLRHAILIGTDLGPNLSITGSLATVLWLIALRREGVRISGWTFLKAGMFVMPAALLAAALAIAFTAS
jgi:arsenical pump membrane protein